MRCPVVIVALAVSLAGCAARQQLAGASRVPGPRALTIELLGFPDCPNTPVMRENLRAALKSLGGGLTFAEVNQESLPGSDLRRGWPAPTVLVNGADLFGMSPPSTASTGCRMYSGGVPSADAIAERVRAVTDNAEPVEPPA